MELAERRIVVMRPGEVGAAAFMGPSKTAHEKPSIVSGHDVLLYVAGGHGTYSNGRDTAILRPNMLVSSPAGSFECNFEGSDHEVYVLAFRDPSVEPADQRALTPSFERILSPRESRVWQERMGHGAWLIERGVFGVADVRQLKSDLAPLVWRSERTGARTTLSAVLDEVWDRIDEPLSLDGLGRYVGYSANYLNDLSREHTGRPVGRWITDMRMSRARGYLEQTDLPISEIGAACGYEDPAYFSRVFRREHSVAPATWRIAAHPEDPRYAHIALPLDELQAYIEFFHTARAAYSIAS
jgi:AraC-like DNA-binding protein